MSVYPTLGFLTGIVVHQAIFIRSDWHLQAPSIALVHLLLFLCFFLYQAYHTQDTNLLPLGLETLSCGSAYLTGLLWSILTYRLFFHPLRRFPGPRLAAASKLWHVWKCRSSLGHIILEEWHQQYGAFVRTGPNELTMFHPGAAELMDSPKAMRSDWYDLIHPRASSIFTRSKAVHSVRRKIWDQALSQSCTSSHFLVLAQPEFLTEYMQRWWSTINDSSVRYKI